MFQLPCPGDEAFIHHGHTGVQRVKVRSVAPDGRYRVVQFDHYRQQWRNRGIPVWPPQFALAP